MPLIDIDEDTDNYLAFAADVAGLTKGQIVARLVREARTRAGARRDEPTDGEETPAVKVYADYAGHRTFASFVPGPGRIEITSGPLAGRVYKTPSQAAREIVKHYNPEVSPHRNGWSFFLISDNSAPLQTLRYR
ncbi:hypothetical protein AB0H28_03145 [Micromonospora sp. NPDC050980]|uniref:hypothetical protein n=1 Tax=Micromonospora sp. NPDC050980 TaxID=3155161 RepID=UPI0033C1F755